MSEWGIALIAAGSAILGSIVTGFFAWKAGHRQAAAAEAAGRAQAGALISTVEATLDEQRRARAADRRRQVYARFLAALEETAVFMVRERHRPGEPGGDEAVAIASRLTPARGAVDLEGPANAAEAAYDAQDSIVLVRGAQDDAALEEIEEGFNQARTTFIRAAQEAIREIEETS